MYSRVAEPFNSIFINNRLNTNSLVEPITKQIELQSQPPFLLYRNQRSAISGFWFYCKEDCVRVHSLLEELIKKCNNARPSETSKNNANSNQLANSYHTIQQQQQPAFVKSQNGKQDVDIFSMLSKAQQDFNNSGGSAPERVSGPQLNQKFAGMQMNHAPPQQQQHQPPPQQLQQQQHNHHQPLVKQLSNALPDVTPPNVMSFFAAAQQPNGGVPVKIDGKIIQSQNKQFAINHPNVPPVQTLDEIEKQHRVSSSPPQQLQHKTGKLNQTNSNSLMIILTFLRTQNNQIRFQQLTQLGVKTAATATKALSFSKAHRKATGWRIPTASIEQADVNHSSYVPSFKC